ncbi:hypothetical protein KQX54_001736 [Cotesia glomerata]|uniref:BEN domain-containing protein n=1 Tax=Cotesia glomerata TaxID=32391 RepID=A0AAV7HQT0_COTGL|nr:hypothetical protein KQX54_001736 [Cotesia glomerata]
MILWALVLWCGSRERDIVNYDSIKFKKNGDASAKWKNKFYSVKVLRTSEDKQWLESLVVDTDGNVTLPDVPDECREKKKAENNSAVADLKTAKKALNASKSRENDSITLTENILQDITSRTNASNLHNSDDDDILSDRGYSPVEELEVINPNNGSKSRMVRAEIETDKQNVNFPFVCQVCKTSQEDFARGIQLCEELLTFLRQKSSQLHTTQAVNPKSSQFSQPRVLFPLDSESPKKSRHLHNRDTTNFSADNSSQHPDVKSSTTVRSSNAFSATESRNTDNQKRFKSSRSEYSDKFSGLNHHKFPQKSREVAHSRSNVSFSPSSEKSPHFQPIQSPKVFHSPISSRDEVKTTQDCKKSSNQDHSGSLGRNTTREEKPKYAWNIPSAKKKELIENSDVYISEVDLNYIKVKFRHDPAEMARRLFKSIIGEDRLSTMSRTGGNGWQPLPLDVSQTVYEYVKLNSKPRLNFEKFERAVTQMFTSIRRTNNVSSKPLQNPVDSKKSSSSTSRRQSQITIPKSSHVRESSLHTPSQSPYDSSTRSHYQSQDHSPNYRQPDHHSKKSSHNRRSIDRHHWSRERSRSRSLYSRCSDESQRKS